MGLKLIIDTTYATVKNGRNDTIFETYDTGTNVGGFFYNTEIKETIKCSSETKGVENGHSFTSCLIEFCNGYVLTRFIETSKGGVK